MYYSILLQTIVPLGLRGDLYGCSLQGKQHKGIEKNHSGLEFGGDLHGI